eukprot:5992179-Prymnesium_polylepis.1
MHILSCSRTAACRPHRASRVVRSTRGEPQSLINSRPPLQPLGLLQGQLERSCEIDELDRRPAFCT